MVVRPGGPWSPGAAARGRGRTGRQVREALACDPSLDPPGLRLRLATPHPRTSSSPTKGLTARPDPNPGYRPGGNPRRLTGDEDCEERRPDRGGCPAIRPPAAGPTARRRFRPTGPRLNWSGTSTAPPPQVAATNDTPRRGGVPRPSPGAPHGTRVSPGDDSTRSIRIRSPGCERTGHGATFRLQPDDLTPLGTSFTLL